MLHKACLPLVAALIAAPLWAQTLVQTLPNGMKIIVKEDRRAPVAVSQIWYKVGSVDEQKSKSGLSHALEHMMFKGTPSVPAGEFSRRVSALGGQNNAYTNRSETVYYENAAAANLSEILKLEADRMQNLNFSSRDFDNEMKVIREERRQRTEDSAFGKLWEHVLLESFTKPSMKASVIGYMDDLHALKADDLRAWYKQWYAPNNAVLVIVGDVDAAQTQKTAADLFGNIPSKKLPARNDLNEPEMRGLVRGETVSAVTHQPLVSLSYRVPALKNIEKDTLPYALDVLAGVLSGHSSSRLDSRLVRGTQSALEIGANYDLLSREMPLFSIMAMLNQGVKPEELTAQIRREIRDIAENGISETELERVQTLNRAARIYAQDSMTEQASIMGRLETRGFGYGDEETLQKRLQQVSAEDVRRAAQLLTDERASEVVVLPEKK